MATNDETIAEILREMRENKGFPVPFAPMNAVWIEDFKVYADRLEAAHKRERATTKDSSGVGDAAKICETLLEAKLTLQYLYKPELAPFDGDNRRIVDTVRIIDAALSAPPRNCDVGTAEEQVNHFTEMRNALMAIRDLAKKTKSRSENINVALTTIFWYANGALVKTEEGGAK